MQSLSAAELLRVWEEASALTAMHKALALLDAAFPEMGADKLFALTMGQRETRLLTVREYLFGDGLGGLVDCPECATPMEFNCKTTDLYYGDPPAAEGEHTVEENGCTVTFRLPNCADLSALPLTAGSDVSRRMLLRRCVLKARHGDTPITFDDIPARALDAMEKRMNDIDPQADIQLALTCEACGHHWSAALDMLAFTWQEIEAWALRTLQQVHALAMRYGWRESDILAMSPRRRQLYIDMTSP